MGQENLGTRLPTCPQSNAKQKGCAWGGSERKLAEVKP